LNSLIDSSDIKACFQIELHITLIKFFILLNGISAFNLKEKDEA